jgi:two-component system OmpR family sensor kinase
MFFITLIAFWLGKLFLSPMRNSLKLLDDFIKDTTHELNTPVSTILTNAELLKEFHPEIKNSKELLRIETASKRLSRIYDDLAYIRLNHKRHQNIESLNVSSFLKERVVYFETIADAKRIDFNYDINDNIILDIDREDMTRIVDNLLGNAFKYTLPNGKVIVTLTKELLSVEDNGIGIDEESKKNVLQRFVRANKSEGGFGLGLSIVGDIAKHYNFDIELQSKVKKGTKVSILW